MLGVLKGILSDLLLLRPLSALLHLYISKFDGSFL